MVFINWNKRLYKNQTKLPESQLLYHWWLIVDKYLPHVRIYNSQKVHFSSKSANNTGHFIDFSPKKSDFFLKMRIDIEHYFDFLAQ